MCKKMKYKFWCTLCNRWDDNPTSFDGSDTNVFHKCEKKTGEFGNPPNLPEVEFFGIYCMSCQQDVDISCLDPLSGLVFHKCFGPEKST